MGLKRNIAAKIKKAERDDCLGAQYCSYSFRSDDYLFDPLNGLSPASKAKASDGLHRRARRNARPKKNSSPKACKNMSAH